MYNIDNSASNNEQNFRGIIPIDACHDHSDILFQVGNASVNFPICFFAGQSFRSNTLQIFR